MINGTATAPEMLPISEMLTHVAELAKAREKAGQEFKCVALIMVDQDGSWAGAVGGDAATDLATLLQTVRDDCVRGGQGISIFVRATPPVEEPRMVEMPPIGAAMNDEPEN
jgi:hypothetical protein